MPFLAEVQQEVIDRDELLSLFAVQWRTVARVAAADQTADDAEKQDALGHCAQALGQLAEMEEKCIRNEVSKYKCISFLHVHIFLFICL